MHIVGVDPGRMKCGVAVLSIDGTVREQHVVPRSEVLAHLALIHQTYGAFQLIVGDRTGSREFLAELEKNSVKDYMDEVHIVDEHLSSLEARSRYFEANPPKGLRRFIPQTMQMPPVPVDDYVAVILAERFLSRNERREREH